MVHASSKCSSERTASSSIVSAPLPCENSHEGEFAFLLQMNHREMQVKSKVCAVALTDSAHNIWLQETGKGTQDWMQQVR